MFKNTKRKQKLRKNLICIYLLVVIKCCIHTLKKFSEIKRFTMSSSDN